MTDTMKAGRELDALIAEKVMGLVRCQSAFAHGVDGFDGRYCYAYPESPDQGGEIPAYSTDIEAAWRVTERVWNVFIPQTHYGVYRLQLNRYDYGQWVCEFATDAEGDFSTHSKGEADTAPLAICLAALAAVERSEKVTA